MFPNGLKDEDIILTVAMLIRNPGQTVIIHHQQPTPVGDFNGYKIVGCRQRIGI
jgi:hypothetical protein